MLATPRYDVVVIGEALVELSSDRPFTDTSHFAVSFSGDALNAAAAAAATGARTALVTRVGDDELGDALCAYATGLGIDVSNVVRAPEPNGLYFLVADPTGERRFSYHRSGSAGSGLSPEDVDADLIRRSDALLVSGVGCAISPSCRAAVYEAARLMAESGGRVVYDPNFRTRLADAETAREHFRELAPHVHAITPSCPHDTAAVLGADTPEAAADACRAAGIEVAAITMGEHGVLVDHGGDRTRIPATPPPAVVDATGCGDAFAGAFTGHLVAGEPVGPAAAKAVALATRCLAGRGGTGYLANPGPTNPLKPHRPPEKGDSS